MREKIGALIQFLAIIVAFILLYYGICGAYQAYFGTQDVAMSKVVADSITKLIIAAIGAGIGVGGVIVGSLLKR